MEGKRQKQRDDNRVWELEIRRARERWRYRSRGREVREREGVRERDN